MTQDLHALATDLAQRTGRDYAELLEQLRKAHAGELDAPLTIANEAGEWIYHYTHADAMPTSDADKTKRKHAMQWIRANAPVEVRTALGL